MYHPMPSEAPPPSPPRPDLPATPSGGGSAAEHSPAPSTDLDLYADLDLSQDLGPAHSPASDPARGRRRPRSPTPSSCTIDSDDSPPPPHAATRRAHMLDNQHGPFRRIMGAIQRASQHVSTTLRRSPPSVVTEPTLFVSPLPPGDREMQSEPPPASFYTVAGAALPPPEPLLVVDWFAEDVNEAVDTAEAFNGAYPQFPPGSMDTSEPMQWHYLQCLGVPPFELTESITEPHRRTCLTVNYCDDPDLQPYIDAGAPFYVVLERHLAGVIPDPHAPIRYAVDCFSLILARGGHLTPHMINRLLILRIQDHDMTELMLMHLPDQWRTGVPTTDTSALIVHPLLYAPHSTFWDNNPNVFIRPDRPVHGYPHFHQPTCGPVAAFHNPVRLRSIGTVAATVHPVAPYVLEEGEIHPAMESWLPTAPLSTECLPMASVTTPVSFDLPPPHNSSQPSAPTSQRGPHRRPTHTAAPIDATVQPGPGPPAAIVPHLVVPMTRSRSRSPAARPSAGRHLSPQFASRAAPRKSIPLAASKLRPRPQPPPPTPPRAAQPALATIVTQEPQDPVPPLPSPLQPVTTPLPTPPPQRGATGSLLHPSVQPGTRGFLPQCLLTVIDPQHRACITRSTIDAPTRPQLFAYPTRLTKLQSICLRTAPITLGYHDQRPQTCAMYIGTKPDLVRPCYWMWDSGSTIMMVTVEVARAACIRWVPEKTNIATSLSPSSACLGRSVENASVTLMVGTPWEVTITNLPRWYIVSGHASYDVLCGLPLYRALGVIQWPALDCIVVHPRLLSHGEVHPAIQLPLLHLQLPAGAATSPAVSAVALTLPFTSPAGQAEAIMSKAARTSVAPWVRAASDTDQSAQLGGVSYTLPQVLQQLVGPDQPTMASLHTLHTVATSRDDVLATLSTMPSDSYKWFTNRTAPLTQLSLRIAFACLRMWEAFIFNQHTDTHRALLRMLQCRWEASDENEPAEGVFPVPDYSRSAGYVPPGSHGFLAYAVSFNPEDMEHDPYARNFARAAHKASARIFQEIAAAAPGAPPAPLAAPLPRQRPTAAAPVPPHLQPLNTAWPPPPARKQPAVGLKNL